MLAAVLSDLESARQKGSMTALMQLTSQAMRLRAEITAADDADRRDSLTMRSSDELVDELVRLIADVPPAVFDRIAAVVDQRRTGRPRVRVIGGRES